MQCTIYAVGGGIVLMQFAITSNELSNFRNQKVEIYMTSSW